MSCSCLLHGDHSPWLNLEWIKDMNSIFSINQMKSTPASTAIASSSLCSDFESKRTKLDQNNEDVALKGNKSLLIKNAFIYCADEQNSVIERGWIHIQGNTISAIGDGDFAPPECADVLDAEGNLVLPGFVNPHWHESFVAPNSERSDDKNLEPTPYSNGGNISALGSMFGFIANVGKQLTLDEGLAIARWSMWTQLRSGTTALGDMGSANLSDAMAMAALDLGMRLRVSRWGSDIMLSGNGSEIKTIANMQEQADDWFDLLEKWNDHPSGLVGGMPSVMGAFGSSDAQLLSLVEIANQYKAPYAMHLAALKNERAFVEQAFGCSSVMRMEKLGLLSSKLLAVHTAYTTDAERDLLQERGVNICHAPGHYGMLGERTNSETGRFAEALKNGVWLSSSTDGDINYTGGMCEAMRAAHLQHNEIANCNTRCPPSLALKTGTLFGAKALGWQARIGSLAVGKEADLVIVKTNDFRYKTSLHPLRTFLISGCSGDIDTVMVQGQILVQAGHSTRFDEQAIFRDYLKAAESARKRMRRP